LKSIRVSKAVVKGVNLIERGGQQGDCPQAVERDGLPIRANKELFVHIRAYTPGMVTKPSSQSSHLQYDQWEGRMTTNVKRIGD
jgi:hypothetical protein